MQTAVGAERRARILAVALVAAVASHAVALTPENDSVWHQAGHFVTYVAALVLGLGALTHAVRNRPDRAIWTLVGLGLLSWYVGTVYHVIAVPHLHGTHPWNFGDVFSVGYFVAIIGVLVLLVRSRFPRLGAAVVLDAAIPVLAVTAICAGVIFGPVFSADASVLDAAATFSQPFFDLVVAATVLGVIGLGGWRFHPAWAFAGGMIALNAVVEATALRITAAEIELAGQMFDSLCPASILGLAYVAARTSGERIERRPEGVRVLAMPAGMALVALLVDAHASVIGSPNWLSAGLVKITLIAVVVRMALAVREHAGLLAATRREARTDALTGLPNRRSLMTDLERLFSADAPAATVLMLFDLDGFKAYNDSFGHPAGDALLERLGGRLAAAVEPYGTAYRLGGDEFCLIAQASGAAVERLVSSASAALSERGEQFCIRSSYGACVVPQEAANARDALQLADQRMYGVKQARPESAKQQASAALLHVVRERDPELSDHTSGVAENARAFALRIGLTSESVDDVVRAADLHDIGKVAVPEAILQKRGRLTEDEWAFIKRHTLIGERILANVPALRPIAKIVRSTHERWDGGGYPDGLGGCDIPLAARIVLICDAYDSMRSERPYQAAMSSDAAVAELRRCAGTQFDPDLVEVFIEMLADADADEAAPLVRDGEVARQLLAVLSPA